MGYTTDELADKREEERQTPLYPKEATELRRFCLSVALQMPRERPALSDELVKDADTVFTFLTQDRKR